MKVKEIVSILYRLAPPEMAMPGDSFGLQVGDLAAEVKKILVCLTLTPEVAREAVQRKVDLIVAHHPLISAPLTRIDYCNFSGKIIRQISAAGISFFNLHTCLDVAPGGVSDCLAVAAGLEPKKTKIIFPVYTEKLYKLAVFVPERQTKNVFQAIMAARGGSAAGKIGHYDSCAFITNGVGTFRPLAGSRPYVGQTGKISRVPENKIETIVSEFNLEPIVAAMKAAHPYEEVAYDIFPLAKTGMVYGLGRVGQLVSALPLVDYLKKIIRNFPELKIHDFSKKKNKIRQVAVVPGSGGSALEAAIALKTDVFLTGELKYHHLLAARAVGLPVIEAGHEASEKIVRPVLVRYLQEKTNLHIIMATE